MIWRYQIDQDFIRLIVNLSISGTESPALRQTIHKRQKLVNDQLPIGYSKNYF